MLGPDKMKFSKKEEQKTILNFVKYEKSAYTFGLWHSLSTLSVRKAGIKKMIRTKLWII